jgi:hypothetical protein
VELLKFAVIVQPDLTSDHVGQQLLNVHLLNVYVYCPPLVVGVAVTTVDQIVNSFQFVDIGEP